MANDGWMGKRPSWGDVNPSPTVSPSPADTAGSKGKIIMSQNVVTRKGIDPANGGSRNSKDYGWGN